MHGTLAELVEHAESILRDHRMGSVRAWKARTGGLAIGYMPVYAPCELLHAQGVLPVAVLGGGDDVEIIKGDAFYQSYICHIPRSTIELALNGSLDCLDGMVFPATCDVIRNLCGVWQLQFPDRLAFYLDVPQNFDVDVGGSFYRRELEDLSQRLCARGARPLEDAALRASIACYDALRRRVRDLYALRSERPWAAPTAEVYPVVRASLILPVEEAIEMVSAYTRLALEDGSRKPLDQARVVLVGSFCEQPPLGLLKALERSGCYIVDDDLLPALRWFRHDVSTGGGDPLADLVRAYVEDAVASPIRFGGDAPKGQDLLARVRTSRAEGVLFCAASFCDPALLDQPMAVRAITEAGIPWTSFKYAENTGQFQVIREQAGTFADAIKLWSGG
jgi:benzoyl-CoA reductase subunit C